MAIITCDIDQFLCVSNISNIKTRHSSVLISQYWHRSVRHEKIPKEMFNMINIDTINFGCFYYYGTYMVTNLIARRNHYLCKWNNFINLKHAYLLHKSFYRISEDGRIYLLHLK